MKFCFKNKDFVELNILADKLAVIGSDFELTWEQFQQEVNSLCEEFNANNIKPSHPVIIYGHKSANMMVAIYAMMKLEITYIPVDESYPLERINKILKSSKSQFIINTSSKVLEFENTTELLLKKEGVIYQQNSHVDLKKEKSLDPVVYIIFTSGSTGEPKGVQISTTAIQSFVRWMTTDFNFNESDVFINTAILSFDLSVFEVMTFAGIGGTILLNTKECSSNPELFMNRIKTHKGSVWVSTPSFSLIYSRLGKEVLLNSVKTFLFCGEVLPHNLAKKLVNNFNQARVINTYGPTEATVATTLVEVTEEILQKYNPLPVGRTKRESEIIIEKDEIIIVGDNVSIGYLNNSKLNSEKFKEVNNKRAFKTGDKGRIIDGMLFFSGRNDDLVKLHGYRIELNEITSAINDLDYVFQGETIALKRNDTVKKIVSLVQLNIKVKGVSIDEIKTDLSKTLPEYMIPSDIKFVEAIPLNNNGKSDKKLLTEIYLS